MTPFRTVATRWRDRTRTATRQPSPPNQRPTHGRVGLKLSLGLVVILAVCTACDNFGDRPQDPVERPYFVEEVKFAGGPGVSLAGELTMPKEGGPFKSVVLISGSGPQDRDETFDGHRPFLVLSDHLTRAGYAVLRYDDRGFADSTGDFAKADLNDFADDAAGAFRYLQSRPEINAAKVGYIGHSEGGYIAPIAARQTDPAFMVFLAGPARPLLPDVILTQWSDIMRAEGEDEDMINNTVTHVREGSALLKQEAPLPKIRDDLNRYLKSKDVGWQERRSLLKAFVNPWGISHARFDSQAALRALDMPVLALFGDKDLQVSAKEEAPVMRASLAHPRSKVEVFKDMNHMFQPTKTGLVSEYSEIETTLSPKVLERISDWIGML